MLDNTDRLSYRHAAHTAAAVTKAAHKAAPAQQRYIAAAAADDSITDASTPVAVHHFVVAARQLGLVPCTVVLPICRLYEIGAHTCTPGNPPPTTYDIIVTK